MSYSGNPSLSADVKERILGTFEQTLDLAREGSRQEALLGCDFVLRLDPQFEPARRLQERLKAGSGPLLPADLAGLSQASAAAASADDPFSALDDLGTELPDLPLIAPDAGELRGRFLSLLEGRRFDELLALAGKEGGAVSADPELQRIAALAQERHEAEPYVRKFLAAASDALAAGRLEDAKKSLAKVRSLDAEHPELGRLQSALEAGAGLTESIPSWSPPPPEAPVSSATLFGGGAEPESDRRIKELLDEGQAAFDGGDPQAAIDSWSRIFLIDIDHQEAARRIDSARRVKAETERQVEEVFHEGVGFLETGDLEGARRSFERVLEIQPSYFAAQEYLQQLNAGIVPTPRPTGSRETAEPLVSPALEAQAAADELSQEILVPPEPGQTKKGGTEERRPTKVAVAKEGRAKTLFLALGGAVLLLALGGGWYLYQQKDSLFPNTEAEAEKAATPEDPIARAEKLQAAGKGSIARAMLRRIQPSDPTYEKAQKLLAEWDAADAAVKGAENTTSDVAADETTVRRSALLSAARAAAGEARYLAAYRLATQADGIAKLDGADAQLAEDMRKQLAPIIKYVDLFQQHEWEMGLRDLWQLHDANPGNRDVSQLIVDSYYNLGVRELQRGDAVKAADRFQEALKLMPDDPMVRRAQAFAQSYRSKNKDLLYRIFVKYLPTR